MIFKLLDAEIHQYSLQRRNNARHSFHFLSVMMRPWTQHHWWINSTPKIGDAANHLSHGPPIHGNPATEAVISIRRSGKKCYQTQRWNGRCTCNTRNEDDKRKKSDEREDGTHADENTAGGIHAADGNGWIATHESFFGRAKKMIPFKAVLEDPPFCDCRWTLPTKVDAGLLVFRHTFLPEW